MADCGYDLQLDVALVDKINISKNISNKKRRKFHWRCCVYVIYKVTMLHPTIIYIRSFFLSLSLSNKSFFFFSAASGV